MHPVPRAQALGSLRVTEKCKSTTYQNNCVVWPTLGAPSLVSRFDYWSSVPQPQHSALPRPGVEDCNAPWRPVLSRDAADGTIPWGATRALIRGRRHSPPSPEGKAEFPWRECRPCHPAGRHGRGGGGERGAAVPGGRVAFGGACSWPRRRRGPLGRWAANKTLTQPLPMIMVKYETYEHDNDKDK